MSCMRRHAQAHEFEPLLVFFPQGKKAKKAEKGASKPAAQRLNHSLDIIGAFGKLKISVPLTSDQVLTHISLLPAG